MNKLREEGTMAFYHPDGLIPAWNLASQFAGSKGKIATLPDIIKARIASDPEDFSWRNYFTSTSSEFFGKTREGQPLLVVCHGVGPMASLISIKNAYKNEDRRCSGKISQKEFWEILDGKYGEVIYPQKDILHVKEGNIYVVDPTPYIESSEFPFVFPLTVEEAAINPILLARFGGTENTVAYLKKHVGETSRFYKEKRIEGISNPYVIRLTDASNCTYLDGPNSDTALAHLLSIGGLYTAHRRETVVETLECNVSCVEWGDGARFIAMKSSSYDIHPGTNLVTQKLLSEKCEMLWKNSFNKPRRLYTLMKINEEWYSQYVKNGDDPDIYEPMHSVSEIEPIGDPIEMERLVTGYYGFFRYTLKEVEQRAPKNANGYCIVKRPSIHDAEGNLYHRCTIQFYRVTVDITKKLPRQKEVYYNLDLLLDLVS